MKTSASLRRRISRQFALVALLPLLVLGIVGTLLTYRAEELQALERQGQIALRVAQEVHGFVTAIERELTLFAKASELTRKGPAEQQAAMASLFGSLRVFDELVLVDRNGNERGFLSRATASAARLPASHEGDPLFRRALETRTPSYGDVVYDELNGEPSLKVALPLPDLRTGEVTHVVQGLIRFRPVWDIMLRESRAGGQTVYLVSADGAVVAHADPSYVFGKQRIRPDAADAFRKGLAGGLAAVVTQRLPLNGRDMFVVAEQPAVEALSLALRQMLLVVGAMLLALLGAIVFGIRASRRISQPIEALAVGTRAVAEGSLDREIPSNGHDEIAHLADDFNRMTGRLREMIHGLNEKSAQLELENASRREAESALQALNADLEERVRMRTEELSEANEELSVTLENLQATQAQLVQSEKLASLGALVAGIAHELNTPIGNARIAASTLNGRTKRFDVAMESGLKRSTLLEFSRVVREGSDIIDRNLERAASLIASFKQVAVDQTSYQRRSFALKEVVDEIGLTLAPTIRHSGVHLSLEVPEGIVLDSYPGPLGRVIVNLINNAVVHAFEPEKPGNITIVAVDRGNRVALHVTDDGKGIPAEHLRHIYDPFFTTRMGQGGSGLGLNIVYNLVTDLLGGEISVDSEPGQGTTFLVLLPYCAPLKANNRGQVHEAHHTALPIE